MRRCPIQDLAHSTALCVARADLIRPVGEGHISIQADLNDNLGLSRKTRNVTRLLALRNSNE